MTFPLHRRLIIACAGLVALGGCSTYDGYGRGYSSGYASVGFGGGYRGWYDDYYYPGSGYYIFDRGGQRYRWDAPQYRGYWNKRQHYYRSNPGDRGGWRDGRRDDRREWRDDRRDDRQDARRDRREDRREVRGDRREDRQGVRQERRNDARQLRQQPMERGTNRSGRERPRRPN